MATKYPRLGVSHDPELERALSLTRPLLANQETRSAAAQVRALALRGADSLLESADPVSEVRRRLYAEFDVTPATSDPRTFKAPEGEIDPSDPTPASDALRWVRGKE